MCAGEIDCDAYAARWERDLREDVPELDCRLAPFSADGLLEPVASGWRLTMLGRIFLRPIAMTFDSYLEEAPTRPAFSQAL